MLILNFENFHELILKNMRPLSLYADYDIWMSWR